MSGTRAIRLRLRQIFIVMILAAVAVLNSCGASTEEQANRYAKEACSEQQSTEKLSRWSKARQLDARWQVPYDAYFDMLTFKQELELLSQYLNEYDTEYRRVQALYTRASLILMGECAAILDKR